MQNNYTFKKLLYMNPLSKNIHSWKRSRMSTFELVFIAIQLILS